MLEDLTLRQSLLVAVGDLLFRHPNVVEPWTGRLYATLSAVDDRGSAAELRLTALLVLTHLVLNDMMKPRPVLLIRALWLTACAWACTLSHKLDAPRPARSDGARGADPLPGQLRPF